MTKTDLKRPRPKHDPLPEPGGWECTYTRDDRGRVVSIACHRSVALEIAPKGRTTTEEADDAAL